MKIVVNGTVVSTSQRGSPSRNKSDLIKKLKFLPFLVVEVQCCFREF